MPHVTRRTALIGLGLAIPYAASRAGAAEAQPPEKLVQPLLVYPRSGGAGPYKFALGSDAETAYPDFAVDQGYVRTKTLAKSLIVGDPGDTADIGRLGVAGTVASPLAWPAGTPQSIDYCWPLDETSNYGPRLDGLHQNATYNGRLGQFYWGNLERMTPTHRGGAMVWSVTMPGGFVNPVDRMWLRNQGLVLPGRAALEDSGVAFPYKYGGVLKHIFAPGPANWYDLAPAANLHLIGSDHSTGHGVIAIRMVDAMDSGWDWVVELATDELLLDTVSAGVRTHRWAWSASGHMVPHSNATVNIGSNDRRPRNVYSAALDLSAPDHTPAASIRSTNPTFTGDVIEIGANRVGAAEFNFARFLSKAGRNPDVEFKLAGDGNGVCDGAWTGGGADYAEWFERDIPEGALPGGWDWVGRTLALEKGRIRPARAGEEPIGAFSCDPGLVGDGAELNWRGKYLKDEFGRLVTEAVEFVTWTEKLYADQSVERQRRVVKVVRRQKREWIRATRQVERIVEIDGRYVQTLVEEDESRERGVVRQVVIYDLAGNPIVDPRTGICRVMDVPVMEDVEIEERESYAETVRVETGERRHAFRADRIPERLVVPEGAERETVELPILNPDFDENRAYVPRSARPEWVLVGLIGKLRITRGQPVGRSWIKMRDLSADVEEWFAR